MEIDAPPRKRRPIYRLFLIGLVAGLIGLLGLWGTIVYLLNRKVAYLPPDVRPIAHAVFYGYIFDDSEEYLETGLVKPEVADAVAKMSQADRVEFFKFIIINCNMDGGSAVTFYKMAEPDTTALYQALLDFQNTVEYAHLNPLQRSRVNIGIDMTRPMQKKTIPKT